MAHPPLTKIERDVLFTVRYEPRVERWDHKTLGYLRSLGLVSATPLLRDNGRPAARYRFEITDFGVEMYKAAHGTPVPIRASANG